MSTVPAIAAAASSGLLGRPLGGSSPLPAATAPPCGADGAVADAAWASLPRQVAAALATAPPARVAVRDPLRTSVAAWVPVPVADVDVDVVVCAGPDPSGAAPLSRFTALDGIAGTGVVADPRGASAKPGSPGTAGGPPRVSRQGSTAASRLLVGALTLLMPRSNSRSSWCALVVSRRTATGRGHVDGQSVSGPAPPSGPAQRSGQTKPAGAAVRPRSASSRRASTAWSSASGSAYRAGGGAVAGVDS